METMRLYDGIDTFSLSQSLDAAEESMLSLLGEEDRIDEKLQEVDAFQNVLDKLDTLAVLSSEADAFVARAKALADVANRAAKRVSGMKEKVNERLLSYVPDKRETRNWKFARRQNPQSVVVDNLSDVPKKYRKQPKPLPEWQEWPVDKASVKQALVSEKVSKISGVHLSSSDRIEIKPR